MDLVTVELELDRTSGGVLEQCWFGQPVPRGVRRDRRRHAAGAGQRDLLWAVQGMPVPLVRPNGGRSGTAGESCVDQVL